MARTRVRTHVVHGPNGNYTRHYHSRQTRGGQWQRTDPNGKPYRRRKPRKQWKLRPKRALKNFRKAATAAHRNRGWSFLFYSGAASSEILAFTIFRGGGALLSVTGVGLTGLGTWMRNRT